MRKIERNIQLGDPLIPISLFFQSLIDDLEEVNVRLSEAKLNKLFRLYTDLNNKSQLWCNCGWSPEAMAATTRRNDPPSISFGPGF